MQTNTSPFDQVVVHPLVLLSIVDHYNRVARDTRKRVVGVLLGEKSKGRLDVTNSFAGAATLTAAHLFPALGFANLLAAANGQALCMLRLLIQADQVRR